MVAVQPGGRYRLLGGPGSPYSFKVRAVLRYRRLPHDWWVPGGFRGAAGSFLGAGTELSQAGKKMVPVLQFPEDKTYHADSTPLIYALERRHPGKRSVIPDDPAQALFSHLIEDMADEWLVLAMFDARWRYDIDQRFCAKRQMAGWLGPVPADQLDQAAEAFRRRQVANREKAVGGEANLPLLQETYRAVLDIMERHLATSPYLFGGRPALGDFGLYGQLSQCAIDPTLSEIMRRDAIRTYQWVQLLDDASGVEGDWLDPAAEPTLGVRELLAFAGAVYLPFLAANAVALAAGESAFGVRLQGHNYVAVPRRYKANCLAWLKAEVAALTGEPRTRGEAALRAAGCWDFLQFAQGEADHVPPHLPL